MSSSTTHFNSLADAVKAMHALRLRATQGYDISLEMAAAANAMNAAPCYGADDAIALLEVVRMLVGHIVCRNSEDLLSLDALLATHSWQYLDRAISHLQILRGLDERDGVAIVN